MKLYSNKSSIQSWQLFKKQCLNLEHRIQAIVNFIDIFNSNYFILNRASQYKADNKSLYYYTDEQLCESLHILDDADNPTYFNLSNMHPHQIVENHFGATISVIRNGTVVASVPQGYALRHDGFNSNRIAQYSVISLASSGTYYTLQSIEYAYDGSSIILNWGLQYNATDLFGTEYEFSILYPDERCYWHQAGSNLINWYASGGSPLILPNFTSNTDGTQQVKIGSYIDSRWTNAKTLWHEPIMIIGNHFVEDILDDSKAEISVVRVQETPQHRYTINSNMALLPDIYINLL